MVLSSVITYLLLGKPPQPRPVKEVLQQPSRRSGEEPRHEKDAERGGSRPGQSTDPVADERGGNQDRAGRDIAAAYSGGEVLLPDPKCRTKLAAELKAEVRNNLNYGGPRQEFREGQSLRQLVLRHRPSPVYQFPLDHGECASQTSEGRCADL